MIGRLLFGQTMLATKFGKRRFLNSMQDGVNDPAGKNIKVD
jgi:hypothetical protein